MTKKKKQTRLLGAAAAVIVLALLYVAVGRVNWESGGETEAAPEILSISPAQISSVTLENTQGTLNFSYDGENWASEDEPEFDLNQDAMTNLMNRLNPLSAERELAEVPESLDAYGLENPEITITLGLQDDSQVQIFLGSEASDGNIYVRTSQSDTVYTADSYLATAFDCSLTDLEALEEEEETEETDAEESEESEAEETVTEE